MAVLRSKRKPPELTALVALFPYFSGLWMSAAGLAVPSMESDHEGVESARRANDAVIAGVVRRIGFHIA